MQRVSTPHASLTSRRNRHVPNRPGRRVERAAASDFLERRRDLGEPAAQRDVGGRRRVKRAGAVADQPRRLGDTLRRDRVVALEQTGHRPQPQIAGDDGAARQWRLGAERRRRTGGDRNAADSHDRCGEAGVGEAADRGQPQWRRRPESRRVYRAAATAPPPVGADEAATAANPDGAADQESRRVYRGPKRRRAPKGRPSRTAMSWRVELRRAR